LNGSIEVMGYGGAHIRYICTMYPIVHEING
jgi:hypothetical protein